MTAGLTGLTGLTVLVVDDEEPARDDLAWSLRRDERIATTLVAADATEALRHLRTGAIDAVFLDIRMPGFDGVELARVLAQFAHPPAIVFVTAFDEHAVEAFDLEAVDYVLKPARTERLEQAVTRVLARRQSAASGAAPASVATVAGLGPAAPAPTSSSTAAAPPAAGTTAGTGTDDDLAVLAVETGGRLRYVARQDVRFVEASGDYARVHTADGAHLVRIAMSVLEARWAEHEFVRIHRRYLVPLGQVTELRTDSTGVMHVVVGGELLPVSRRSARDLRDRMADAARRGVLGRSGLRSDR